MLFRHIFEYIYINQRTKYSNVWNKLNIFYLNEMILNLKYA